MSKRKIWLGSGVLIAAGLLLFGLPLLAANHWSDFGRMVEFKPLVRHMVSQVHCYDLGTDECEETSHLGTDFIKEHTLGFLLDGSRRRLNERGLEPVYLCEARDDSHLMMVTAGTTEEDPRGECREAGFRAKHAGYIFPNDQLEAPWPLYRCLDPGTGDTLLTDDPAECTAASYDPAELLGYLYAGGPQPLE